MTTHASLKVPHDKSHMQSHHDFNLFLIQHKSTTACKHQVPVLMVQKVGNLRSNSWSVHNCTHAAGFEISPMNLCCNATYTCITGSILNDSCVCRFIDLTIIIYVDLNGQNRFNLVSTAETQHHSFCAAEVAVRREHKLKKDKDLKIL